jgi:hypothetical protein
LIEFIERPHRHLALNDGACKTRTVCTSWVMGNV